MSHKSPDFEQQTLPAWVKASDRPWQISAPWRVVGICLLCLGAGLFWCWPNLAKSPRETVKGPHAAVQDHPPVTPSRPAEHLVTPGTNVSATPDDASFEMFAASARNQEPEADQDNPVWVQRVSTQAHRHRKLATGWREFEAALSVDVDEAHRLIAVPATDANTVPAEELSFAPLQTDDSSGPQRLGIDLEPSDVSSAQIVAWAVQTHRQPFVCLGRTVCHGGS